jgi:hypothetical protein
METKMPKLTGRIQEVIKTLDNGNVKKFSKRLKNVSQQRLNRIFNLDTRTKKYPSVPDDVLVDIATSVPNLNLDWLLTGEGEMLKSNINNSNDIPDEIKRLKDELIEIQRKYITLVEENRELKNALTAPAGGKLDVAKKTAGVRKRKSR